MILEEALRKARNFPFEKNMEEEFCRMHAFYKAALDVVEAAAKTHIVTIAIDSCPLCKAVAAFTRAVEDASD